MSAGTDGMGLRQRTRDTVRQQIAEVALVMFDEQGFDETTVDQIAAAACMSPRSFFRYFASKEDVVLGDPMLYGEPVRERLAESLETMPVWQALRAGFEPVVETVEADPERTLRATRVMINTPCLRARNTEKHLAWMTVLVPLVATALAGPEAERQYRARAITLCALTCLDVSSAELVHRNGAATHRVLLDEAFRLLKPTTLVD
ncbi:MULTISPECIES: TetR family transcriptional regulator [unclassified Arthrobacter]|uniref:TetR family transcriptional regulator n=1 Tax=unclassified Arthrobacter TaxID=235627 RepID=UPI001E2B48FC|nr:MULTISPECIES: TetR family transcriptional regulator [unclassified Arthrobacter]MCC9146584.1 TetR/AcrR family transcriptional regulator [Arthrobacter sp. zg-Y919]MDK1277814.1 TetR family transcriptional regulator [Arthrobacter sp. zg.Y919]MDM7989687.1 TetR family transcriptional regulator [Arthrobacter sp. zg-Y877]WIB02231.1 TetR family transcriptional regulator [Arthrobacter sp. zg-Y919]